MGRIIRQKISFLLLFMSPFLVAKGHQSISTITPTIKKRMITGGSYKNGCPVKLSSLRYLKMNYINFAGKSKTGEMIVHKSVAREVMGIFKSLYEAGYPIRKMQLVSDYQANDFSSIEADNTSAFNCRRATGSKKWSRHSYGKAIDINPLENPYISRKGHISHKKSLSFRNRTHSHKSVILKSDLIVKLFKRNGWRWGGDWRSIKDYQHFDKR